MSRAGRFGPETHRGTMLTGHPTTGDSRQLSESMAAILSAGLEEGVARGLVADIVKGVLDESRLAGPDRAVDSAMREARRRLDLFRRARAATAQAF